MGGYSGIHTWALATERAAVKVANQPYLMITVEGEREE